MAALAIRDGWVPGHGATSSRRSRSSRRCCRASSATAARAASSGSCRRRSGSAGSTRRSCSARRDLTRAARRVPRRGPVGSPTCGPSTAGYRVRWHRPSPAVRPRLGAPFPRPDPVLPRLGRRGPRPPRGRLHRERLVPAPRAGTGGPAPPPGHPRPGRRARGPPDPRRHAASSGSSTRPATRPGRGSSRRSTRTSAPEPLLAGLPRGLGARGSRSAGGARVAGVATDDEFSIWVVRRRRRRPPAPQARAARPPRRRVAPGTGSRPGALSADDAVVVLEVMEDGDVLHPSLRSSTPRPARRSRAARTRGWSSPAFAFSPSRATCGSRSPTSGRATGGPALWHAADRRAHRPAARPVGHRGARRLVAGRLGAAPAPLLERAPPPLPLRARDRRARARSTPSPARSPPPPSGPTAASGTAATTASTRRGCWPSARRRRCSSPTARPPRPAAPFETWWFDEPARRSGSTGSSSAPTATARTRSSCGSTAGPTRWTWTAGRRTSSPTSTPASSSRWSTTAARGLRPGVARRAHGQRRASSSSRTSSRASTTSSARGLADPARVVLAGWSWGGYVTLLGAGRHPDRCGSLIAGVPVADYVAAYEDEAPMLQALDRALFGGSPTRCPDAVTAERNPIPTSTRSRHRC